MKLVYVCSAGNKRSPTLALYTKHFSREYGMDGLKVYSAGLDPMKLERDRGRRPSRIGRVCKEPGMAGELERSDIHPRFGLILLEEGVPVGGHESYVADRQFLEDADLVLAVDRSVRDSITGHNGNIYTVKEFLGYPVEDWDVRDPRSYLLPFLSVQLRADRKACSSLRRLSREVLDELSADALPAFRHQG